MSIDLSKQIRLNIICATVLVATCFLGPPVQSEDWPQFRGHNCTGISTGKASLPVKFSDTENHAWSQAVGDGVAGAVVAQGRAFVSGMTDKETISLFAIDLASGKQIWRRDWATGPLPEIHAVNSYASATPAADADRVYFYFSSLGLITVDSRTGRDVWEKKLPDPFFVFKWGPGMSPVLYKDMLLFCQDDDLYPTFYAFDKVTGQLRWKDDRLDQAVNYSHPVICNAGGRDEIVVAGTGMLIGYDPESGERRWHARVLLRNIKTTPVCAGDMIYISIQSGGIANQWLASVDQNEIAGNNDGRLEKSEIQRFVDPFPVPDAFFERTFDRGDLNQDGFLEGRELDVAFLHPENFAGANFTNLGVSAAEQYILAVRGGGRGDVTETHLSWKHPTKHTDHIVSPLVSDGRMLLVKSGGIATVFETENGSSLGKARRVGKGGDYFASPVAGDGKIYLASKDGNVVVLRDDATYEQLANNDMGEPIIATPAIADGRILVRTRQRLLCFALDP